MPPPMNKRKKRKKKPVEIVRCQLTKDQKEFLDYKDVATLRKFVTAQGKILSRKGTGCDAQQQRVVAQAIKHARHMAFLPFVSN